MKSYLPLALSVVLTSLCFISNSQDRTSSADGTWSNDANWSNQAFPPLAGQDYGTINVNHNMSIPAAFIVRNGTLNVNMVSSVAKTLTINGNFSTSGGGSVNVYGTLIVNGDLTLSAPLQVHPGGKVVVTGNVTVNSDHFLRIGDDASSSTAKADFVVQKNLIASGSGDVTVAKQGRLAVFGDMNATGGGTFVTISQGGLVYVDGDGTGNSMTFVAGGNVVNNNNADINYNGDPNTPYGFYVNGSISDAQNDGSVIDADRGDKTLLQGSNPDFFNWLVTQSTGSFSSLPIELISFSGTSNNGENVLEWITASEKNFEKFLIERASSDLEWVAIDSLNAKGGVNKMAKYEYVDQHPGADLNYYRLKSIDFDRTFELSKVILVKTGMSSNVFVYPNPVTGNTFSILSKGEVKFPIDVRVIDIYGRTVWQSSITQSNREVELDEQAGKGVFFLKVKTSAGESFERIIVK